MVEVEYFFATRTTSSAVIGDRPLRVLLVVIVGQRLQPQAGDGAVDRADRRERAGQALHQRVLRRLQLFFGDGPSPRMPRSSFMNSTSAASLLSPTMSPPVRNGFGPFAEAEAGADAVAVSLLLANIRVQARLEHAAENRVHHLQRVIVGRVPRRARQAERKRRLRRARLVDEINRRRLRRGKGGKVNAGRSPPAAQLASPFSMTGRTAAGVTSPTTVMSARPGLKYSLMKIDDVGARDGLDGLLGRRLAEDARRRTGRVETRATQSSPAAPSPGSVRRAAARAAVRAPPAGMSSSRSMSARMSSVAANCAVVLTKLIDPLSPPTPTETFVPSSCSAFDSSSPFRVFVPSLIIDAARLPTPRRSAVSN